MTRLSASRPYQWAVAAMMMVLLLGGCAKQRDRVEAQPRPMAGPGGPLSAASEQDRAAVANALAQNIPAEQVTDKLIELTRERGYWMPVLASGELQKRSLSGKQLQQLTAIAHEIPFISFSSCMQIPGDPKYENRSGEPAWNALAHTKTLGKPVAEQVAWLVGELRFSNRYGASPADSATHMLEKIGEPAVAAVIAEMQRKDPKSQHMAARTLADIASPAADEALEEWALEGAANSDDVLVWAFAPTYLADLHSERAFPAIEQALWRHIEEYHAFALVDALVRLDPVHARGSLERVLTEYEPDEQHLGRVTAYMRAASELYKMGDPLGKKAIEAAARSPLKELRRASADGAHAMGDEGIPILRELAAEPDRYVSGMAHFWLDEFERQRQRQTTQQK